MTSSAQHIRNISAALAFLFVSAGAAAADVLYSSGLDTLPSAVLTVDGSYGNRGIGDDYNAGYVSINITGLRFYGGLVGPNDHLFIDFYDPAGNRVGTIAPYDSDVRGSGLHVLRPGTFGPGNASFLPGVGSIIFAPYQFGLLDPANPPRMHLGFATAPTIGGNDPALSTQSFDDDPRILSAPYASGIAQYAQFEISGTGNNAAWAKGGSGTWADSTSWTMAVPDGSGAAASFLRAITSDATVTLASGQTVGDIFFDNARRYTLAGPGTLTLAGTSGAANVYVNSGSHTITAPVAYPAGASVRTAADPAHGMPSLTLPLNVTAAGTLTKSGSGTLAFAASNEGISILNLPAINIQGGEVALQSNIGHANRTLLTTSSLTVLGGSLDLGANDFVLLGGGTDGAAMIRTLLAQGCANGTWLGAGISSSAVAGSTSPSKALGYLLNTTSSGNPLFTTFDGLSVSSNDVLVKYTIAGDSNLDGSVGFDDLLALAQNYQSGSTAWASGDFNYDNTTDFSDLLTLAQNYNAILLIDNIGDASFMADWSLAISLVPEPSVLSLLFVAGLTCVQRERSAASRSCSEVFRS